LMPVAPMIPGCEWASTMPDLGFSPGWLSIAKCADRTQKVTQKGVRSLGDLRRWPFRDVVVGGEPGGEGFEEKCLVPEEWEGGLI